ncbi:ammonium transporter [Cryobacterium sp. MDB1-18-2]|uniref:Ammonium transporter n=2 Tax=Microbacteriaceae TaxID=85023 RepID=A0ABY2IR60_9MICO|nr:MULTISPECIES: ammonium transporter [Cryobacterium]MDY7527947.1 ammonium transporter [Cryobacterium sp. 10C2]MEB0003151.1 ammonium transporter [Cryobacterium sp. RTC2.1]MEB0201874.1 ammonium transporter [Cryobacterium sp. 5I3]MEB0288040.1 ammonium transporter [Cryobacterium sp. 10S3]MEB0289967.1 ammonium transporter [Cryobacterium sp. 10C2]
MVELSVLLDDTTDALTTNINSLWLLVAAALVLLMTPGVAFFYGGMVKAKSVISMMMMSFGAMGLIGVLWVLYGYGLSFGPPLIGGWLGNPSELIGLNALLTSGKDGGPDLGALAFAGFQATFAIITVALISGAIADRAKFGAWMIFAGVWATLVYFPVAYWVFNLTDGWAPFLLKVNDFAGGTAVHINAGAAGLALALVLGKRVGFKKGISKPHNVPLTLLGAALLWFGWFGFNAGSEAAVDGIAALAWINTLAAPAAGIIGWLIVEKIKDGKPTMIGAASGAVAGLVAITPACNILTPMWGILLGLIVGAVCAVAIDLKFKLGFDDSLDVVGIHLVGGIIGTLYVGLVGNNVGLLQTGSFNQLGVQALAAFGIGIYSFVMAYAIGWIIQKTIGFRITNEDEVAGVDTIVHGEEGYALDAV